MTVDIAVKVAACALVLFRPRPMGGGGAFKHRAAEFSILDTAHPTQPSGGRSFRLSRPRFKNFSGGLEAGAMAACAGLCRASSSALRPACLQCLAITVQSDTLVFEPQFPVELRRQLSGNFSTRPTAGTAPLTR